MFWWFCFNYPRYPRQRRTWIKVKFLYETEKAILVYCKNEKIWIPKSRIYRIRLRKNVFEVYVKKSAIE